MHIPSFQMTWKAKHLYRYEGVSRAMIICPENSLISFLSAALILQVNVRSISQALQLQVTLRRVVPVFR